MTHCNRPFQDCPDICEACARPTYTLQPPLEPLRTKLVMLAFTMTALSVLALAAFSGALDRMHDVNRAYQEDTQ